MLTKKHVDAEEERLRRVIQQLSEIERKAFFEAVRREVKDPDTYAVLNWFLLCGLHHLYLGKWLRGLINLTVCCVALILMMSGLAAVGAVLLLAVLAVELPALFRSQLIVQDWNNSVYKRRLAQLGMAG